MIKESFKNFITIADCGSISRAADKLLVAQPALSYQLKSLETELNARLFIRGHRYLEMTSEGEILYERIKAMIELEETAIREIEESKNGVTGRLSVVLPITMMKEFVELCFSPFLEKFQKIHLEIHEAASEIAAKYVLDGIAEIAVITAPVSGPHMYELIKLEDEMMNLYVPKTHPWATKAHITKEEFIFQPIIIPRGYISTIRGIYETHSAVPNFATITSSKIMAVEFARIQNLPFIVPVSYYDKQLENEFTSVSLDFNILSTSRSLIYLKGKILSREAELFLNFCKQTLC
jgi:DNA-binding transcriptional LysR family regulator